MAISNSTPPRGAPVPLSVPIRPAIVRGQPVFTVGAGSFTSFRLAACAWSAAEAHRLDIAEPIDRLIVQHTAALAEMRRSARDVVAFASAARREAELALQIRRLRASGGAA